MTALAAMVLGQAPVQASPQADMVPANTPAEILAYYNCVTNAAEESEARTRDAASRPAPDAVFTAAENSCRPLYDGALKAFYATTMKTEEVQAYIRGKNADEVRTEVEAGLRSSLKDRIVNKISLLRGGGAGDTNAQD